MQGDKYSQQHRQILKHEREPAQAASALSQPNICTIHDIGEQDGQEFIAMELLEGRILKHLIAGQRPETVPKAFIVATLNRRPVFDRQVGRRTFASGELAEVCQLLSYDDVKKLVQSSEVSQESPVLTRARHSPRGRVSPQCLI